MDSPGADRMISRRWMAPGFLGLFFAASAALWVFLAVSEEVVEGETRALDIAILLAFRPSGHPEGLLGPRWLQEAARDITGLGSAAVLGLIVAATIVFLLLARKYRTALFVLAATSLGYAANSLLKMYFNRPRPDLIPNNFYVTTASFPSGHAMLSATVYLTLGAVLARLAPTLRLKLSVLCVAALLSGLVGLSRVYLGVHWPSDVLAGWAAGAAWAFGAWGIAEANHIGNGSDS